MRSVRQKLQSLIFRDQSKENVQVIVTVLFLVKTLCYWLITTIHKKINFSLQELISFDIFGTTSTQAGSTSDIYTYFFVLRCFI